jgi:predicted metalloprotease with PDZ domain
MKKLLLIIFAGTLFSAGAQENQPVLRYSVDLTQTSNDQLSVELICPSFKKKDLKFFIPKTVPGTYSEDDYGRFIEDFKALDKKGNVLKTKKLDKNGWLIERSDKLVKITYKVNDTFDAYDKADNTIFEPSGTSIEKDTVYLINNHGLFGYFSGYEKSAYEVTIKHAPDFYGSTALTDSDHSNTQDVFLTDSYNLLVDSPILYCKPDTTTVKVGNTDVLISVYSPSGKVTSKFLAEQVDPLLQAQGKYLGGSLPVDKYAFLVYFDNKPGLSGSEGALEHSYSSVYYFQEYPQEVFGPYFTDIAAHEFFHILTPLNIHSEQIHDFNFNYPEMSKHLWLYEGSTEYHAHIVQTRYGLKSPEELYKVLTEKINSSQKQFDDRLSFTEMSKGVLKKHQSQFGNVYQKGALISLCLDILLREESGGKKGIIDLVLDLSKKFGKDEHFQDDQLFDEIQALSSPAIKNFLVKYVEGSEKLPLKDILKKVGLEYEEEKIITTYNLGNMSMAPANGKFKVMNTDQMNAEGKELGYQVGDILQSVNGEEITIQNYAEFRTKWLETVKEGDDLTVGVLRKNESGNEETVLLKAKVQSFKAMRTNVIAEDPQATEAQVNLRKAWLNQ